MSSVYRGPNWEAHLRAATDNTVFLHTLQQLDLTHDWLPFSQTVWIRDVLHGSSFTTSRFADGVCNEICAWMLMKWARSKPKSDYLSELERNASAEAIAEMADGKSTAPASAQRSDVDYLAYLVGRDGVRVQVGNALTFSTATAAVERAATLGNAALCMYGVLAGDDDGHTILVNGRDLAIFDPNIGYIKALSIAAWRRILGYILEFRYPELKDGVTAIAACG